MKFRFVYVDDDPEDKRLIEKAVNAYNENPGQVSLCMTLAEDVDAMRKCLSKDIDLVLADVNYEIGGQQIDRLSEIIDAVKAWTIGANHSSIPIIAYTGYGAASLRASLERKKQLFDIWDKDSCSGEYVTWRLSKMANELSRLRPDTFLLRLIQEMRHGSRWHDVVIQMPISYNIGKTESAQIEEVGQDIEKIAQRLHVLDQVGEMWKVMRDWEMLSRAVSPTVRGHARHVVNVFWMGYYLIHNDVLANWFAEKWQSVISDRMDQLKVSKAQGGKEKIRIARLESLAESTRGGSYLESLSDAWYFAALFHDVGSCLPKYREFRKVGDGLVASFGCKLGELSSDWIPKDIGTEADSLFRDMDTEIVRHYRPLWVNCLRNEKPDHGVVGAIHLRRKIRCKEEMGNAFEAARAICSHNLIGEVKDGGSGLISWERDPLSCLLVLCDQIQTWDRERGDEDWNGPDFPSRAQLTALDVVGGGTPRVEMGVQYIIPPHVEHSEVLYRRMRGRLEKVMREKPMRALGRIGPGWPFQLLVRCSLGGEELLEPIKIGC
jgi:hypothetical protein